MGPETIEEVGRNLCKICTQHFHFLPQTILTGDEPFPMRCLLAEGLGPPANIVSALPARKCSQYRASGVTCVIDICGED